MCKKFRFYLLSMLALVFAFSLAPLETIEAKEKLTSLDFVLDYTPNTNHTGIYVAQAKGYFKEQGLKVSIIQPPEDGAPALVASGKAKFGIDYQDTLAPAFALKKALPVTAIASLVQHNTSGIISLKDNPVQRPKNMEGKAYATWGLPIEQAIVKNVVAKDGGDPKKVKFLPEASANIYNMSKSDYDCVWVFYAWDVMSAKANHIDYQYFAFRDINDTFDYYTPVIIGNNRYMKQHPKETKKFLAAVKKGYEYAIAHPKEAADILLKAAPELDKETVYKSQDYLKDQYIADAKRWGEFDKDRWNRFYEWLAKEKLIDRKIPKDFGFSNAYLPE